jgi:hypothetical protein
MMSVAAKGSRKRNKEQFRMKHLDPTGASTSTDAPSAHEPRLRTDPNLDIRTTKQRSNDVLLFSSEKTPPIRVASSSSKVWLEEAGFNFESESLTSDAERGSC